MLIIITTAFFLASFLTLFSGFGLGTLLMPVAAVFFPIATAVALTAFAGVLAGKAGLRKVTIGLVRKLVAIMLLIVGGLLMAGIL